jgi:hypothetical protein
MVTTVAVIGAIVVLLGLASAAYAIYLTGGRDESRYR